VKRKRCLKKKPYQNKRTATQAISDIKQRDFISNTSRLTAYKCKYCLKWHVGNRKPNAHRHSKKW
jgi:hypothetical protein